ncbi:hypothetical protein HJG60_008644 [Phyllostomus discolor]|uniref:Uncharacterized protein n=1 Tax=Phyllostomus discolor TaxID=89673 RepID=A0A834DNM5_9CHIR|nr:hypothetical protein HJG60_008644 [Phyllostomus discolor]
MATLQGMSSQRGSLGRRQQQPGGGGGDVLRERLCSQDSHLRCIVRPHSARGTQTTGGNWTPGQVTVPGGHQRGKPPSRERGCGTAWSWCSLCAVLLAPQEDPALLWLPEKWQICKHQRLDPCLMDSSSGEGTSRMRQVGARVEEGVRHVVLIDE